MRNIILALLLTALTSHADGVATLSHGDIDSKASNSEGSAVAFRVEGMLKNMKNTLYQAKTEIDEDAGSFHCDCSGFVGYVLRNYFPEAYLTLRGVESPWRKRPYSVTYYETFVSAGEIGSGVGGWRRIRKMTDVRPGDVLAWRKKTIKQGVSTGHTCMIAGMPIAEASGRIRVRVIDSTNALALHANDTRAPGTSGVGAGEMWFTVNAAGEPTGFFVNQHRVKASSNKVAIGRLIGETLEPTDAKKSAAALRQFTSEPEDAGFVGLEKGDAIAKAEALRRSWRIVREDEVVNPVSMRIRDERINFIIVGGKVIRVRRG